LQVEDILADLDISGIYQAALAYWAQLSYFVAVQEPKWLYSTPLCSC